MTAPTPSTAEQAAAAVGDHLVAAVGAATRRSYLAAAADVLTAAGLLLTEAARHRNRDRTSDNHGA